MYNYIIVIYNWGQVELLYVQSQKQAVWINLLYWNDYTEFEQEKNIEHDFCPHRQYIVAVSHKVKLFQ